VRAFLAAYPDEALRDRLAGFQQRLQSVTALARARVTWTRPDMLHVTCRFFATLDDGLIESMRQAMESAIRPLGGIRIPLSDLGAFPRPRAPGVLWVGPPPGWETSAGGRASAALASAIDEACARVGVARADTPWRPHLTLARIRDGEREVGRVLSDAGLFDQRPLSEVLTVNALTLVRSDARADGHSHTTVWTLPLLSRRSSRR